MNALSTSKAFVDKWAYQNEKDSRLENVESVFDDWVKQIPEDMLSFIFGFLDNFQYYSHKKANDLLKDLHSRIVKEHGITTDDTIFTCIESTTGRANSSNAALLEYQLLNQVNKESVIMNLAKFKSEYWSYINNIVVIDDCCGTGESLSKLLENYCDVIKGKNIYYLVMHIMQDAIGRLKELSDKFEVKIIPIYSHVQKKAFSDTRINCDMNDAKKKTIQFSSEQGIPFNFALGFEESEGLFAFYNNTPNNTIGLFWFNTGHYFSLFPRKKDDKPLWMKRNKSKRCAMNYNLAKRKNK